MEKIGMEEKIQWIQIVCWNPKQPKQIKCVCQWWQQNCRQSENMKTANSECQVERNLVAKYKNKNKKNCFPQLIKWQMALKKNF